MSFETAVINGITWLSHGTIESFFAPLMALGLANIVPGFFINVDIDGRGIAINDVIKSKRAGILFLAFLGIAEYHALSVFPQILSTILIQLGFWFALVASVVTFYLFIVVATPYNLIDKNLVHFYLLLGAFTLLGVLDGLLFGFPAVTSDFVLQTTANRTVDYLGVSP